MEITLTLVCIISLPMLFLLESITWYIRSLSIENKIAWVIAKTNMVVYFSRFFYLAYLTLIYYQLENGSSLNKTLTILFCAFLISVVFQGLIFTSIGKSVIQKISNLYGIEINKIEVKKRKIDIKLFIYNVMAVILISLGVILPAILAYIYPNQRLTLSVSYQIMNAFGTFILLSKVDPVLSESMDLGYLNEIIRSYLLSRILAFTIGALFVGFIYIYAI